MNTAIIIASGPSLTIEDVEYCRGKGRVYAVKEAALMAPWADVLYAADHDWWKLHQDRWQGFAGEKWTVSWDVAQEFGLKYIAAKSEWKWSTDPNAVATGGNSGFQALNLAVLQGAERVILLGFDYGYDPAIHTKHWWDKKFPRHSWDSNYAGWNHRLADAVPLIPVPVLNASRLTSINCLPKIKLEDVL